MSPKIFRNRFQKQKLFCKDKKKTSSAVLVPSKLYPILKKLLRTKNKTQVLQYLLSRYKSFTALGQIESSKRIKTLYQKKGQNLQRISFKPENDDWTELGIIATGLGCSRTWIFTYFLWLETKGIQRFFAICKVRDEVAYLRKFRASSVWRVLEKKRGFERILWYMRP